MPICSGGVPTAEIESNRPLFEALGLDPAHIFVPRQGDSRYQDFAPSLAERAALRPLVENDPGVQERRQNLHDLLTAW